jgi:hypothetical protein
MKKKGKIEFVINFKNYEYYSDFFCVSMTFKFFKNFDF